MIGMILSLVFMIGLFVFSAVCATKPLVFPQYRVLTNGCLYRVERRDAPDAPWFDALIDGDRLYGTLDEALAAIDVARRYDRSRPVCNWKEIKRI